MAKVKTAKGKDQISKSKQMSDIYDNFITNLNGLGLFFFELEPVALEYDKNRLKRNQEHNTKLSEITGIQLEKLEGAKIADLPITKKQREDLLNVLTDVPSNTSFMIETLYWSSFVMLLSYFDFLISDLIRFHYRNYPESLSGKDLSLSLSELKLCKDIDEAIEYLISKEVDSIMYKSLSDQRKYLQEKFKIDIKVPVVEWNIIDEAMERRNIIVHNNSIMNRRYLKNLDLTIIPEGKKEAKEGARLILDVTYFRRVLDEIFIGGNLIAQCCWRKWLKDDLENADTKLSEQIYDSLINDRWMLAEKLGLFGKQCEHPTESLRLRLHINYCQALKWQGKKNQLQNELCKVDIESLSPKYKVAYYALKDNKDDFFKNVENAIVVDDMIEANFMKWPLFKELREGPNYEERIKKICEEIRKK